MTTILVSILGHNYLTLSRSIKEKFKSNQWCQKLRFFQTIIEKNTGLKK